MERRNSVLIIVFLAIFTISASVVRDVIIYQPKTPRMSFIETYTNDRDVKDKYRELARSGWQEINVSVGRAGQYGFHKTFVITAVKY